MILAQNHQLQLSGNKILVFAILFFAFACSTTKNIANQGQDKDLKNTVPTDLKDVTDYKTIDTFEWKEVPSFLYTPLADPKILTKRELFLLKLYRENSELLEVYDINLYLPFFTSRFSNTDINFNNRLTEWSFHFYNGLFSGLNEEQNGSSKVELNVIDTEANPNILEQKLIQSSFKPQLIFGPFRSVNVEKMVEYAVQENIPFVSPYSGGVEWGEENDTYIKINPGLSVHFQNQLNFILDTYTSDQILVIGFENIQEKNTISLVQSEYSAIRDSSADLNLDTYILPDTAILSPEFDLSLEMIDRSDTLAVMVPSWSNESYILSLLRNLSQLQSDSTQYVVFGMPQWKDYEHIDYSYYQKLNVHITSGFYLNPNSSDLAIFRKKYFLNYGFLPANEAYIGYDLGRFFIPLLREYGTKFYKFLDQFSFEGLHTNFEFKPVYGMDSFGNSVIVRWENTYLNILKFSDYEFIKVN